MAIASTATIAVRNPRTGRVDHEIQIVGEDEVVAVCQRLRGAQAEWSGRSVEHRIRVLEEFSDLLRDHRDDMVDLLTVDTGRRDLSEMEVDSVHASITRGAEFARAVFAEGTGSTEEADIQVAHDLVPFELVGVIAPWNFPLQLALIDAVPALLAGASCILKPSEITPRFAGLLTDLVSRVSELDAVLQVVLGGAGTGAAIVANVDVVSFTGSVATGRMVGESAGRRGIPAFLEMGGKDPAIVVSDADVDAASSALLWGSTANSGHSCMSIERVYVDAMIADEFVAALVAKATRVKLAHPAPADGQMGPIINQDQVQVIETQLADAVAKGARVLSGGDVEWLDGGAYLRPTVLVDVNHDMAVMRDETFGPVIPVMTFETLDQAVALANDSTMGLSGAVFSEDPETARRIASRMLVGAVSINDACLTGMYPVAEKNAFKASGVGPSRMGPSSVARYLRKRAFLIRSSAQHNPWFYDQTV